MKKLYIYGTLIGLLCVSTPSMYTFNCYDQDSGVKPFYIALEYLIWKPQEESLAYAVNIPGGIPDGGTLAINRFIQQDQCFKYGAGVRATAGYSYCQDWDTAFAWTHLKTCSFGSSPIIVNGVFPIFLQGILDNTISSQATAAWNLTLNELDLEIARTLCIRPSLTSRGHLGIRGINIEQDQFVNYLNTAGVQSAAVNRINNILAVGPRMGFDTQWHVGAHTNIIGALSGSLLYGKFVTSTRSIVSLFPEQLEETPLKSPLGPTVFISKHRIVPTIQMLVGLDWEKAINNIVLDISVGYEVNYWWSMFNGAGSVFTLLLGANACGALMTHGLTVCVGTRF